MRNQECAIRIATIEDAKILCTWWNDGRIMAHAGFIHGINTTVEKVEAILSKPNSLHTRYIITCKGVTIGEMSSRDLQNGSAEIGIKICDETYQNKGYGKVFLSLLIQYLFDQGFKQIILDTNVKNLRAQKTYESLGFDKVKTNLDAWQNTDGEWQSSIDYTLSHASFKSVLAEKTRV